MLRPLKLPYFILFAGIFILVCGILLGSSLAAEFHEINGLYGTNKITANVKNNLNTADTSAFTLEDMRILEQYSLKGSDFAYASYDKAQVVYKNKSCESNILGVSEKYIDFNQIRLKSGSFLTSGNDNEDVAVIDQELAYSLFNNDNVLGMEIELYGRKFRIIGVQEDEGSIIRTLAGNGYGSVYIPVKEMLDINANSRITYLELKTSDTGTSGKNMADLTKALASINKPASNYKIIDYNVEKILLEQKKHISIFIMGLITAIMLVLHIKVVIKGTYDTLRLHLKEYYMDEVLRQDWSRLLLTFLLSCVALAGCYILWENIKFNLYIPPEYIPSDLIDMAFYSDLVKNLIQTGIQNTGYIPVLGEMKLNALKAVSDWVFYIGLFAGFPLLYLGIYQLRALGRKPENLCLSCGIFTLLSSILGSFITLLLKMPVYIDLGGLIIMFSFIFIYIIRKKDMMQRGFQKRKFESFVIDGQ